MAALLALMLILAASWGLQDVLWDIHRNWIRIYGDFAHGYLVLAMCLWLVVRDQRQHRYRPDGPWWPALLLLGVLVLTLAMLSALGIGFLDQSLVPVIALASVTAIAGLSVARQLIGPVLLLYMAMPLWWIINIPLQRMTAAVANGLVQMTGVPAFVDGNSFHLPAGVVQVASGCSGLNYLVVALALGLFQGLLYLRTLKSRIKLLAFAAVAALICNWIRVYSLIVVGYATDMQHYLIRVDHLTFGWLLFMVCFWPVLRFGVHLANAEGDAPQSVNLQAVRPVAGWMPLLSSGVAAAALLLVPSLASHLLDWRTARVPGVASRAEAERARFDSEGRQINVQIASASTQASVQKMPDSAEALLGRGWQARTADGVNVLEPGGLAYEQYTGLLAGQLAVVRSGQVVAGHSAAGKLQIKLAALKGLLQLRHDERMWLVSTPCNEDCSLASAALDEFLREHAHELFSFR